MHADLNDGLVAYYPFNGNANDESGNGNDGTVNGATLTDDRFGNSTTAYSFDGVDDYIQTNHPDLDSQSLSISVWFKPYGINPYTDLIRNLSNMVFDSRYQTS